LRLNKSENTNGETFQLALWPAYSNSLSRHPYISRMTPSPDWHNRIPSFMNGPFSNSAFSPGADGKWKNVLGTFPSLKVGSSMYCSAVLGTEGPQNTNAGKKRLRIFKKESDKGVGRSNPSIYTRIRFEDLQGDVYRLRSPDDFSSVFGSYGRSSNQNPLDGITPAMAQQCNLCSNYGPPLPITPKDETCKTNKGLYLRYDLAETLQDTVFNTFVATNSISIASGISFLSHSFNTSTTNEDESLYTRQLLGMELNGSALPYELRPCSGNVQTMPAGMRAVRVLLCACVTYLFP